MPSAQERSAALEQRGMAAHASGNLKSAEELFRAALAQSQRPLCWLGLGLCQLANNDSDGAVLSFTQASILAPQSGVVRHLLDAASGQRPARAPEAYLRWVFDKDAERFDEHIAILGYQGPAMLSDLAQRAWPVSTGLRILDLGCGTGLSGLPFRPYAAQLDGLDVSTRMLERAQLRGIYDHLYHAEAHVFLADPPCRYDAVIACDMAIYTGDLVPLFGLVRDALEPGGSLFLTLELSTDGTDVRLMPSGRFRHSEHHLAAAADEAGFSLADRLADRLRVEAGQMIAGMAVRLTRP